MRLVKPGPGTFARPREASGPSYYRLTADLLAAGTVLIAGGALVAVLSGVSVVGRTGGSLPAPAAAAAPPLIAAPAASPAPAAPSALRLRLRTASSSDAWAESQDSQAPSPESAAWGAALVLAPGDQPPGDMAASLQFSGGLAIPQLDYGTATSAPTATVLGLGSWQAQFLDSAGVVVGGPEESVQGLPVPGPRHVAGPLPAAEVTVRELQPRAYELGGPGQQKPGFRLMCDACPGLRWAEHWLTQRPTKPAYTTYSITEAVLLDMALIYVNQGGTVNLAEWNF